MHRRFITRLLLAVPLIAGMLGASCAGRGSRSTAPAAPAVLPAAKPVVLSVQPWQFDVVQGSVIRTEWYRLFTTETDRALLDRLPGFLELSLNQYTGALAPLPRPPIKLDTYLMANRAQWVQLTRQLMGEHSATFLRIQRGGFAFAGQALLWSIGPRDTLAIAAHEGWHQYTQRTFRDTLPVWLEEGVATYMEGYTTDAVDPGRVVFAGWANAERFDQLRTGAARGAIKPLDELLSASPQELIDTTTDGALNYYAQVWALTHFLNEGEGGKYRPALERVLVDAAQGRLYRRIAVETGTADSSAAVATRRGPAAFAAYFNGDIKAAGAEYAEFIARVVAAGSRDRVIAGRSPVE